jgi:Domain of unknown function (DUF5666)
MASHRNRNFIVSTAFVLIISVAVFAHEGGKHFLGTVKAVDSSGLTIVTDTETVTVIVLPTTKIVGSGHPAALSELKPGERVVVHAKQSASSWTAEEIRFGPTNSSPGKKWTGQSIITKRSTPVLAMEAAGGSPRGVW